MANCKPLPGVRRESLFSRFIHQWQIQVFALAGILYLILFSYLPMFGIVIAFKSYKLTSGISGIFANNWVGLKYFREFVTDYRFGELVRNTVVMSALKMFFAFPVPILLAIMISYLTVRRPSILNHTIDTVSMLPYIMPGSVIAIALLSTFSRKPLVLTGTLAIMIIAVIIRRLPYTTRSATATLIQIPMSIEEASISLGASKMKTFFRITVPMMSSGIVSGAILSWVSIVTEVSSAVILYNNRSITLTVGTYSAISRGNFGAAAAFATVTTVLTALSLVVYMRVTKSENIEL